MYNLPEISESVEELDQRVRKENDAQIQRRFHMLLLLRSGEATCRRATVVAGPEGCYRGGVLQVSGRFAPTDPNGAVPIHR